jgi:hypothetical protein
MTTIKLNEEFDFGFTSVDESDINNDALNELAGLSDDYKGRLHRMHKLITPLINNLAADADTKAYIHWPNRKEKLIQFQEQLDELLKD